METTGAPGKLENAIPPAKSSPGVNPTEDCGLLTLVADRWHRFGGQKDPGLVPLQHTWQDLQFIARIAAHCIRKADPADLLEFDIAVSTNDRSVHF